jgi:2-iminobutanoate/2-iminopropanoate deaminase
MSRIAVNAAGAATIGPYSHAVEANGLLILSGQTPVDPATGKLVEGGIARQTDQCFRNLFAVLAAAKLTADDVVAVQVYLTDMSDFPQMNAAYAQQFSAPYPARTTIGCASLPLNARIEIGMIAKSRRAVPT